MESHITSEGERERKFRQEKENKSCIFNPHGSVCFHGVFLSDVVLFCAYEIIVRRVANAKLKKS